MDFEIKAWRCPVCTYDNTRSYYYCYMCEHKLKRYSYEYPTEIINRRDEWEKVSHMKRFMKIFGKKHVLLPVIHCSSVEQTIYNCDMCFSNGVDGIIFIFNSLNLLLFRLISLIYIKSLYLI